MIAKGGNADPWRSNMKTTRKIARGRNGNRNDKAGADDSFSTSPGTNEAPAVRPLTRPHFTPFRLTLVDDDPSVHETVREQLRQSGEPWHVTSCHSGAEALKKMAAAPPHTVLMDITMPEMSGIERAHQMKRQFPGVLVVMLTRRAQPELVMSALRAGARGYVVKTPTLVGLVPLLNKAVNGGLALCAIAERLLLEAMQRTVAIPTEWGLTQREEEVLLCLGRHLSDKEMSAALGIAEKTVHVHLASIFKKLRVHDRKAAVKTLSQELSGGGKMAGRDFCPLDLFRPFEPLRSEWQPSLM